ncbi:hypothetical protein [Halorubellus sp. PRR65]|uniref:hypothetical protein n=1 Tax=Halorubellus sp. PRR65 TaxID=3098148 RepID=UPI002B258CA0|nr:hypothetical protein [Halorubellus sp. PRR65]
MSTRTDATYDEPATTSQRTDPTTSEFSTRPEDPRVTGDDARPTTRDSRPTSDDTPAPDESVPWTERCKRQFSTTSTARMRNLNDDENHAMHDGV